MADAYLPGARLADPHQSIAILIGAAGYDHLGPLPTVERNLTDLHDLLRDDRYWGLPADRPPGPNPSTRRRWSRTRWP